MDYWIGFFLGPRWADTDYRDRRHPWLYIAISMVLLLVMALYVVFPTRIGWLIGLNPLFAFLLGFGLFLGLPVAASRFFRFGHVIQLLILVAYLLQYYLLLTFPIKLIAAQIGSGGGGPPAGLINFADSLISMSILFVKSGSQRWGLLTSIFGGVILGGLAILGTLLLALAIPVAYLLALRSLQRLVDLAVSQIFPPRNK